MTVDPEPPHQGAPRSPGGGLSRLQSGVGGRGLVRPRRGKIVAGVLAGLGRRFGISPWAARALFVLSLLFPGPQFVAYLVMWVVMPREP